MGPKALLGTFAAAFPLLLSVVHGLPSVATLEPAAAIVPETVAAGAPLLQGETVQLTEAVIQHLEQDDTTAEIADLFAFATDETIKKRDTPECKTYPGDDLWPADWIWDIFNRLLGNRLIPTVPIAAPCYDTEWGPKDQEKCNSIVDNFNKAPTQYVLLQLNLNNIAC